MELSWRFDQPAAVNLKLTRPRSNLDRVRAGSSKKNCHRCHHCHRFRGDRVISSKFSVAVLTDTAIVRLFDGRKLPSDGIWWQLWQWWQYCHSPLQIQNNRNKSMNQFQIIHLLSIFTRGAQQTANSSKKHPTPNTGTALRKHALNSKSYRPLSTNVDITTTSHCYNNAPMTIFEL